jgi:hypothetical protein
MDLKKKCKLHEGQECFLEVKVLDELNQHLYLLALLVGSESYYILSTSFLVTH